MFLYDLIISLFLLSIIFIVSYSYGYLCFKTHNKFIKDKLELNIYYLIVPLVGFAFISIIFNYFYFLFNVSSKNILILLVLFQILIFLFYLKDKAYFQNFYKIYKISLSVSFIFIFFLIYQGEQFYIFRGNFWDSMNYISQAILIQDFKFDEILKLNNDLTNKMVIENNYQDLGSKNIKIRPLTTLNLALIFNFDILNYFLLYNIYKVFLVSLVFLSFSFISQSLNIKNNFFYSLSFILSFWFLYIFEVDALSHLTATGFLIGIIALIIKFKKSNLISENVNVYLFMLLNISFYFFYPELFAIFILIIILFFLFKLKSQLFLRNNLLSIIFLSSIFFIVTLPLYLTTYLSLITQVKVGLNDNINYWGYFSGFIIGKDSEFLTIDNINFVKTIFKEKSNFYELLKNLIKIFFDFKYYFFPLNIIPSFFGLYFLTASKFSNYLDLALICLSIFLNFYLIKVFFDNLKYILKHPDNTSLLIRSSLIIFIFLFCLFFYSRGYWQITKLYIYLGPIIFIFMSINFIKSEKYKVLKLNRIYIILLLLFPIYKYSDFNYGIGRYDTFPSIISPYYKKSIKWEFKNKDYLNCKKIFIDNDDPIINGYLSIHLKYLGFKYDRFNSYKYNDKNIKNNKLCKIKLFENKLNLKYE